MVYKLLKSFGFMWVIRIVRRKKMITVIYRDCNTGNGSNWTPVDSSLLLQFI